MLEYYPVMEIPRRAELTGIASTLTAAAVGLSACTSGEAPTPIPTPAPDMTKVSEYVRARPNSSEYLNTADISSAISTSGYGTSSPAENPYSKLKDLAGDAQYVPSAPFLQVNLGQDGELHFTASDKVPSGSISQLLRAVEKDADDLKTTMKPASDGKAAVDSVRFRIYDPKNHDPEFPQTDDMEYVGEDSNDSGRSNIYYILPGAKSIHPESMSLMLGHENTHAALGQRAENWLTKEQAGRLEGPCKLLGRAAVPEAMLSEGPTVRNNLNYIRRNVPAEYRPAYDRVLQALQDGTYTDIPPRKTDTAPYDPCDIQQPGWAVLQTLNEQGQNLDPLIDILMDKTGTTTTIANADANATNSFNSGLEHSPTYAPLREATYLPKSPDTDGYGHPFSNNAELSATILNVSTSAPKEFLDNMRLLPVQKCQAVKTVADLDAEVIATRYPGTKMAVDAAAAALLLRQVC
jgi:hypothetical protein